MGLPNFGDSLHNIPGGTQQAQLFLVLHEMADTMNVISPDGNDPTGAIHKRNDATLQQNCNELLGMRARR
jgi:hypothetical protein